MYAYFFTYKKISGNSTNRIGVVGVVTQDKLTEEQENSLKIYFETSNYNVFDTSKIKELAGTSRLTLRTDMSIWDDGNIIHYGGIQYITSNLSLVSPENIFGFKELFGKTPVVFDYHKDYSKNLENTLLKLASKRYSTNPFVSTNGSKRIWAIVKF